MVSRMRGCSSFNDMSPYLHLKLAKISELKLLALFTVCFMMISLQSLEQTQYNATLFFMKLSVNKCRKLTYESFVNKAPH